MLLTDGMSRTMRQIAVLPYSRSNHQHHETEKCQIPMVSAVEKMSEPMYNILGKRTIHYGGVDRVKAKD